MMNLFFAILFSLLEIIPSGKTYLKPLQERDSILVADQIEYGFVLDEVKPGTKFGLPEVKDVFNDTLVLVREWQLDTLYKGKQIDTRKFSKLKGKPFSLRASLVISPFEEGKYQLPDLPLLRQEGNGVPDTLLFEAGELDVKTMPVDTATFEIHALKPQMEYPVTFAETVPYGIAVLLIAGLVALLVWYLRRKKALEVAQMQKDPPHIVALRELDKFRSEKYWAPEKQKAFYSGITDALKAYIDARFGVDAPEMTTAELFAALKNNKDITPDLYGQIKSLFETADFVKFAKHLASDEDNANALPVAVRFVTSTYQAEIEEEKKEEGKDVL